MTPETVRPQDFRIILCSCPPAKARELARALVEERLAACVSVVPAVGSVYRWEGAVEEAEESLLVAKTTAERYPALAERLVALHPYEVPELLALPVAEGSAAYLAWVAGAVAPEAGE